MLFNVYQINANAYGPPYTVSPYAAGSFVLQCFAATPTLAVTIAANTTGISASSLQATPVVMSAFQWHP